MRPKLQRHFDTETSERQSPSAGQSHILRRWITASETAAMMGVSRMTVYRLHAAGKLPSLKYPGLGVRVDREGLVAMLERASSCPSSR